jgi:type II secretory pathway component GspD/PulD (secretin)
LRTNSLIVGGTEQYVTLAGEIIESLDSSPAQERRSEVYRLKNSRAIEIQTALQNFLKQDTALLTAAVGTQALAQELLDREFAIVAETNSNTLLVSASPRNFAQVTNLIEQLDQPQRQVLIQCLLAEVTLNQGDELGVEWTYQSGGNPRTKTGTDFGV